jgi:hypothetical protein
MGDEMIRTTVMIPGDLKARAVQRAHERGISFGELVREALAHALAPPRSADPLFADAVVHDGESPAYGARDHDRHLYGDEP